MVYHHQFGSSNTFCVDYGLHPDRQAKMFVEVFRFLMTEFKTINEKQADRHREIIESLLGLVDELAARSNPDKVTYKQLKSFEDYLKSQAEK